MHRPNRIGAVPLIHLDLPPIGIGTIAAGNNTAINVVAPMVIDTTVRTPTCSRAFHGKTPSMATTTQITIAHSLNGSNPSGPLGTLNSEGFQLNLSGTITMAMITSTAEFMGIMAYPFVARAPAATLTVRGAGPTNTLTDWSPLPFEQSGSEGYAHSSFSLSVILGQYEFTDTYDDDPILFGFILQNMSQEAQACDFRGHLSGYKYIEDLKTFDPTRS